MNAMRNKGSRHSCKGVIGPVRCRAPGRTLLRINKQVTAAELRLRRRSSYSGLAFPAGDFVFVAYVVIIVMLLTLALGS